MPAARRLAELAPEDRLCLLLVRRRFSPDVASQALDCLGSGLRWDRLLPRAAERGLIPLLYHRLLQLEFRGVPPPVRRTLADTFGTNAMRSLLLERELVRALTQLAAAGITVIPLKGIPLALSLYGDSALRACADLDILIPPRHLRAALDVLHSLEYRSRFSTAAWAGIIARYGRDCAVMREDGRQAYPLQVHCGLIWGGATEQTLLAELWSEAAPGRFQGAPAWSMSPEWEFLYLAAHAAKHGLCPSKWLVDLDWLIVRGALDWEKVAENAQRLAWEKTLQSCFAACAVCFETPVPEPFANKNPIGRVKIPASCHRTFDIPRGAAFCLRLLPNLAARIRFAGVRIFIPTPTDAEFLHLPTRLFFLYYLIRPWRLAMALVRWSFEACAAKFLGVVRSDATHSRESLQISKADGKAA